MMGDSLEFPNEKAFGMIFTFLGKKPCNSTMDCKAFCSSTKYDTAILSCVFDDL